MKENRKLIIKGAILDKNQLENYLEKIGSDHILIDKVDKNTYPIPRLKEDFFVIKEIYKILNEQIKEGIPIHPAGEWILDNFYIIEEITKGIIKELTLKKYNEFLGLSNGRYKGFARVYVLATEMVAYTDGRINSENLTEMLKAYQSKKTLNMNEIWEIGTFLQIALIENIREICETIYMSQMQKYKVEDILSRFLDEEKKKNRITQINKIGELKDSKNKGAFIEYMSYKLKKLGSRAFPYLNVLEEEVAKTGTNIDEIIKKEHFDIAVKKVSIGNAITSLKTISRINFLEIFEKINQVEEILKQDPLKQYKKMDSETKSYYRNTIQELSKETKISEIYIAKKCLELSLKAYKKIQNKEIPNIKKAHIGYYLISNGKEELLSILLERKIKLKTNKEKVNYYILGVWSLSFVISLLISYNFYRKIINVNIQNWIMCVSAIIVFFIIILPVQNIISKVVQYISSKVVKPKLIPKLDFENGIPEEFSTMVVIPTILKNKQKVRELMKKLEVYYIANKSENLYFTLLGDCTSGDKEVEDFDDEIMNEGIKLTNELNRKYDKIFNFIYRKRIWNEHEDCYMGWERKRGLLNQFNEYLLGHIKDPFKVNTIGNDRINNIKYIITLDSDTDLSLKSGLKLVGAMAHILNMPILNEKEDLVVEGHALIQPRVGVGLLESRNSIFTQIYAGEGGTDSYTNVVSNFYQDNFDEGIFTGKGIYDLNVFSKVLKNEIKENTVLSHDLLEGSYLRCGLASDIMLMDGFPSNYNSFRTRLYRWIRGDYQILPWLRNRIETKNEEKENPLNLLSKYKIFSNIVRSKQEVSVFLIILFSILVSITFKVVPVSLIIIGIISIIIPLIIDVVNNIISSSKENIKTKRFVRTIDGLKASFLRGIIDLLLIPDKMYITIKAEIKTIYRMCKSKKHLLEWVTSEEAEKMSNNDIKSYYKNMLANLFSGLAGIIIVLLNPIFKIKNIMMLNFILIVSILWLVTPLIMYKISQRNKNNKPIEELDEEDKRYLFEIAYKTWLYFKENLNKENNYLIPDNYQEGRKPLLVKRTSSTNIGLGLLAVMASYDLNYERIENVIDLLYEMINTINNLQKWNGHLYNWYNIETLEPLVPKYVSSVDSGNFVGYLYVLKQFFVEQKEKIKSENKIYNDKDNVISKIECLIEITTRLIENTDFSKLYDNENQLFSIGFNVEENKLTSSYYDLLASEARQTSLVAIAKHDITEKHWYNLSRTFTTLNKYKGLLSWSGTSFEYLMPTININQYPGSILDESCSFMIMSQLEYARKLGIPWGISEAAFNLKDLNNNYQYKAFGIPWLGLKRGLSDEIVVSTYGSVLAINKVPKLVIENLKLLESKNMYGKYGFYESIDFTPGRTKNGYTPVKTYMAHHQGLILLSIDNLMNDNIIQKRFKENPEIEAIDILLQEKMPQDMITTKEEKEKIEKIKYVDYEDYTLRQYTKINENLNISNVIANDKYTIVMDQYGNGYSKYKDIQINRYKKTEDISQGINFFIKNIRNNKIWTNTYSKSFDKPDKYNVIFAPELNKFVRNDENIKTTTKVIVDTEEAVEIRRLELENVGLTDEILEITGYLEPIISNSMQDYAHKAFNNLFLSYEYMDSINAIIIKRKAHTKDEKETFMAISLYTQANELGELEFEIDKEKFWGRCNYKIPKEIENSNPFSKKIGYTIDPIVALKRIIKIKSEEITTLDLIISVGEEKNQVIKNLVKFMNNENIKRTFELLKAKSEAENRYLGIRGKDIEVYQNMLSHLLFTPKVARNDSNKNIKAPVSELWKYGVSGDLPILLVKIDNINDIDTIREVLSAYEFFRVKNINIDLIILNEEIESYENYVKDAIQRVILNKNIGYLLNIPGGIFLLENIENKDKKILEARANLEINAKYGSLELQMKDILTKMLESVKEPILDLKNNELVIQEEEEKEEEIDFGNLKYFNEYGGFSNNGKEYLIKLNSKNKLPTVWSHVIANKNFGTLITENMGGYTWYKNSRLNRITGWSNDAILDSPSEIIYLKDMETNKKWSLGFNPMHDKNNYYIIYGFGYAKYIHSSSKIKQTLETFIPQEENVKINLVTLENKNPYRKNLKLIYYIKPVLGEDEIKSNSYIDIEPKSVSNIIFINNLSQEEVNYQTFIGCSEKINSYTGSKNSFFKNSSLENPVGLDEIELNRENSLGQDGIVAIQINITIEAFEKKEMVLTLGTGKNKEECQDIQYKYSNINNCIKEYNNVKKYWEDIVNRLQVNTPIESTNILLNGWLIYQTISSRILGKTGFYQSGGAYGFRDQLQDSMLTKYVLPEITKEQIIRSANHQFIEGDVEHWWHEDVKKGIRTKISDDLLWLPYVTSDYIEFTEDYSILDEEIYYKEGKILEENENERYDLYNDSKVIESLYEHCIRAIEKTLIFGENGLPLIGTGDWNDGFNNIGPKGIGESVWLGFFLYAVLKKFIKICKYKEDLQRVEKYEGIMEKLKRNLNNNAWDGRWFKRAFTDDKETIGSLQNEECKIDSISQSWSVISGAGDNDKKYIAMGSLENHLIDKEIGIIKLLDPPFEKSKINPGYIKAYLPGTRENGGQYTHAAVWTIIAQAILNLNEKAYENFRMINPIEHARTKDESSKYKVEPYVMAADVYGKENLAGRGGWTWYTGSSSWMYIAGIKYILGLNIEDGYLKVNPHIPNSWQGYEIRYKYYESIYNIKVINTHNNEIMKENVKLICNEEEIKEGRIKLDKGNRIYNIQVEI